MTKHDNGDVPTGGTSYLMPICSYHNHYTKTGPFEIRNKIIIVLSGFLQRMDTYATFAARLPTDDDKKFGLVFKDEDNGYWQHIDITAEQAYKVSVKTHPRHILIEKSNSSDRFCKVADICL